MQCHQLSPSLGLVNKTESQMPQASHQPHVCLSSRVSLLQNTKKGSTISDMRHESSETTRLGRLPALLAVLREVHGSVPHALPSPAPGGALGAARRAPERGGGACVKLERS